MIRYSVVDNTGERIGEFKTYEEACEYMQRYIEVSLPQLREDMPEEMQIEKMYIYKEEYEEISPEKSSKSSPVRVFRLIEQKLVSTAPVA